MRCAAARRSSSKGSTSAFGSIGEELEADNVRSWASSHVSSPSSASPLALSTLLSLAVMGISDEFTTPSIDPEASRSFSVMEDWGAFSTATFRRRRDWIYAKLNCTSKYDIS